MSHALSAQVGSSSGECLTDSILRAVAAGSVQEPLLSVYLDHVECCDACCARIEREVTSHGRFVGSERHGDDVDAPWLEHLKQATGLREHSKDADIGDRLGRFRVTRVLGAGASSIVYDAIDEDLDRPVVLKVLRSSHSEDSQQHQLLVSEARALASLQHAAIMPLLQLFWHEATPVLVFPKLPGETLAAALAAGRCSGRQALKIIRDVAGALAHTHRLGIFHLDVKPSNIWLHRKGSDTLPSALLFDFGLTGSTTATAGTPGYIDPELSAAGDPEDRDLFSLGVVLHECLTATHTTSSRGLKLVRELTASDTALRPRAVDVVDEINRLLARPWQRWRTELRTALAGACLLAAVLLLPLALRPSPPPPVLDTQGSVVKATQRIAGTGLPVALSNDAGVQACVIEGPAIRIRQLADDAPDVTVRLAFKPDHLGFTDDAAVLAASDATGNVAIIDMLTAEVAATHRFPGGVQWTGWSGWRRNVLVVQSGDEVFGFFVTHAPPTQSDTLPDWALTFLRDRIMAVATLPGTEAVLSLSPDGTLTTWSVGGFSEDTKLPVSFPVAQGAAPPLIGWRSVGVSFLASGQKVLEVGQLHSLQSYNVGAPIASIVWPDDTRHIVLTKEPNGRSRLFLGEHRAEPEVSREFDLEGRTVDHIVLLDDHRQLMAITIEGDAFIFSVPPGP